MGAWLGVTVNSDGQRLGFSGRTSTGKSCSKAIVLYKYLHVFVEGKVKAYVGTDKSWYCEGILGHLYAIAPCRQSTQSGTESVRPQSDEDLCTYWEGICTGQGCEITKKVNSRCVMCARLDGPLMCAT